MAELVQQIQDLVSLDADVHWFCPRHGTEDGSLSFDEDLLGFLANETEEEKTARAKRIEDAKARTAQVLDACTILAFDGGEAHQYQNQLKDNLKKQLTRCDICVREFHRSRSQLRSNLESDYASDEVDQFMRRFDEMNTARISAGLNSATEMLFDLPPEHRNIAAAGEVGMYALFEALNCLPFLENEEALKKYFDKPFQLVQSKKKIKLPSFAPGMAAFLFSSQPDRSTWAAKNFASIKRPLTCAEFDHSMKPALEHAMSRVNISFLDTQFLPTFWRGTRIVMGKLTQQLVTEHLRALDVSLYTLSLEHFQVDSPHFDDLVASYQILLELSPDGFWDAMGNCNPQQLIEQIFRSPYLERLMTTITESEPLHLDQKFAWTRPFIMSIKPENLVPPVRVLADQLLKRCQAQRYSRYARNTTWQQGLTCLAEALQRLRSNVRGGPVLTHMAELIAKDYIHLIMSELDGIEQKDEMRVDRTEGTCLLIIKEVLAIDVQSLTYDRAMIAQTKGLDHELGISSLQSWKMSMRAVRPGHSLLATALLSGIQGLLPLEMFASRQIQAAPRQAQDWNSALNRVMTIITDEFLERLQAFEADNLVELFQEQDGATGVMTMLFSGDDRVHHPALNMIKTMSGEDSRRDSVMHIVKIFTGTTLRGAIAAVRAIAKARVFTPSRTALRICTDIYSCLCDTSDGVLRSSARLNESDLRSLETFWQITWMTLDVVFEQTEPWSNLGHEKSLMQTFCRETMDFADHVFDRYSVVATTLKEGTKSDSHSIGKQLLNFPKKTFTSITKWLRLRDDYLIEKAVSLTTKMLGRLHEVDIQIAEHAAESIESVLTGRTRTKLSMNQKATIQRALEKHMGTSMSEITDLDAPPSLKQSSIGQYASSRSATPSDTARPIAKKPGAIDVDKWSKAAAKTKESAASAADIRKLNSAVSSNVDLFRKRQDLQGKKAVGPATVKAAQAQRDPRATNDFVAARKKAKEEADRNRAAAAAKAKGLGAGSGVSGLGDIGKDHTMKGQNVMVSSDDESESDDDLDDELFGGAATKSEKPKGRGAPDVNPYGAVGLKPEVKKGPTRIQRTQRSVKDMRARLAPDLGPLHRVILKWDFFHEGDYPPGSNEHLFRAVSNVFMDPTSYQETFQPLLTLEAWQGMVKARDETPNKAYEIKVINRSNVDQFIEISSSVTHVDNRELSLQEGDIILLSTAKEPVKDPKAPHCLARIYRVKRQKAFNEIVYQFTGGSISNALSPGANIWGCKVQSITPLEREYGALQGLQYYDLCNQIVKAKPSPRINYTDKQIGLLMDVYNVNRAQSEAINAALDNEGFSLIQGPPGSGKTKTIVAIVGGLLSNSLGATNGATRITMPSQKATGNLDAAPRKLLVCAPSNAAVDELVMRLKEGVKTKTGKQHALNVVRIGRSDAINAQVVDVTMDELVAKQLGASNTVDPATRAKNAELYKEHQKTSADLQDLYKQRDSDEVKGEERSKLEAAIVATRKHKQALGIKIDTSKDQEKQAGRENDLNRKRARQAVLDNAHVICATLSGSGHDMFQSLNIEFETVIIDEAAQCVEMSSLIPLKYGCVKCIMVGDPKQLPPTVFSKEAAHFQYEQSLFVRMQNNFADEVHLLDTQYRMHPDISIFPSRTFYDGLLKDGDGMAGLRQKPWHKSELLAPYRFYDVKGQQTGGSGKSLENMAEVEIAMELYQRVRSDYPDYDFTGRIGIITPYKAQLRLLKNRFANRFGIGISDTIEFNTTDAFQGRESEIIIFSCVRASQGGGIGFLQDIRRMNVGLTRAKSSLWVLGNSESLMRGQYWRKLVEDARERDSYSTGDLKRMLQQHSNAFPASNMNTASMMDVGSHVSQMQTGNKNHTHVGAAASQPAAGAGGMAANADHRSNATPAQQSDSSRKEGVTYRYEDRVANKKRPAETSSDTAVRPRTVTAQNGEDVEMEDAQSDSRTPVDGRTPTGLDGTTSRAETPLSADEKPKVTVNGAGKTKKPSVPPTVPQPPVRRKKPAADPFLPRKR